MGQTTSTPVQLKPLRRHTRPDLGRYRGRPLLLAGHVPKNRRNKSKSNPKPSRPKSKPKPRPMKPSPINNDGVKYTVIYPEHSKWDTQKAFIRANLGRICQGLVNRTWVTNTSLKNADALVMAYTEKSMRHGGSRWDVKGFAILNIETNSVFIDLICARGYGSKLIATIEREARKLDKRYVSLSALPHVINYYRRIGFVHATTGACKEHDDVQTEAEKVKNMRFADDDAAAKNRAFARFLRFLVRKGFNKDPTCKSIKKCNIDGYLMRKCL